MQTTTEIKNGFFMSLLYKEPPNGLRYLLVGGTRERLRADKLKIEKKAKKRGESQPSGSFPPDLLRTYP